MVGAPSRRAMGAMALGLALGTLASPGSSARSQAAEDNVIVVHATSFRSDEGRLRCWLFTATEASAFPRQPRRAFAASTGAIASRRASCAFRAVPAGRYAVALHHDGDGDGAVDTGLFGIPTEGLAASNDATGSFGPPSFAAAAFDFAGGELVMRARIGYVF